MITDIFICLVEKNLQHIYVAGFIITNVINYNRQLIKVLFKTVSTDVDRRVY